MFQCWDNPNDHRPGETHNEFNNVDFGLGIPQGFPCLFLQNFVTSNHYCPVKCKTIDHYGSASLLYIFSCCNI